MDAVCSGHSGIVIYGGGVGIGIGVGQCRHTITDQAETRTTKERNIGAH